MPCILYRNITRVLPRLWLITVVVAVPIAYQNQLQRNVLGRSRIDSDEIRFSCQVFPIGVLILQGFDVLENFRLQTLI